MKTESRTSATAGTGRVALLLGGVALVAALAVVSVCVGARSVPPGEIWRAFTDHTGTDQQTIVRDVRVPRTFLAVCVGAALGVSGALVQTLTRNPLAEPGIMGLTSGAGFAIIVGTVLGTGDSQFSRLLLAAAGAVLAAAVVYGVGRTFPLRLILAGVALTFVLSGLSLGMRLVDPTALDRLRVWTVGSLAGREQLPLTLPVLVMVAALAGALLMTRPLGGLALGEQVAHALGAHVGRIRVTVLLLVTLLVSAATAVAGPIAFAGLIVPHLARRPAGASIPWLVGYSMVLGPVLLLVSDVLARLLLPAGEVPVAIVTAFLGGPALIWAVRRHGTAAL